MATATVSFPSIQVVAAELHAAKVHLAKGQDVDVRLQVTDGDWTVHTGDASFDTDHRGYWGAGTLTRQTNSREVARDLIDQAKDDHAQRS
jgi:hypothetical protein